STSTRTAGNTRVRRPEAQVTAKPPSGSKVHRSPSGRCLGANPPVRPGTACRRSGGGVQGCAVQGCAVQGCAVQGCAVQGRAPAISRRVTAAQFGGDLRRREPGGQV